MVSLFPLSARFLSKSINAKIPTQNQTFFVQSYSMVHEDFSNTTFKDGATTAFGWGTGGVTANRNFTWNELGFYNTPYPVRDIDVDGRYVYYVNHIPGFAPYDLQAVSLYDPSNLRLASSRDSWTYQLSIAVEGDLLMTGTGSSPPIISTYNNTSPYELGVASTFQDSIASSGKVTDIDIEGPIAYYTSYGSSTDSSFNIVNTSTLDNILEIPCNWNSNWTLGLEVEGRVAYLAESINGLYILNITEKNNVVELAHIDTPGNATDVIIDGGFAYLADGPGGVHVIDIRNPSNPEIKGTYDTPGDARRLVLQGKTLFVADVSGGVIVLDVADPEHPTYVTEEYPAPLPLGDVWDVDIYGGILVVGTNLGIYTYEIAATSGGITDFSKYAYLNPYSDLKAYDVRVRGDIAYVVGKDDGLYTLNVRNPDNPILLDQSDEGVGRFFRKLEVRGNFAYVCDYGSGGGLRIYDVSDPTNIFQTDILYFTYATDVALHGDIAYIADGTYGVYVANISNPYNIPISINYWDVFNNVTSVWVQGPHLYVVDHDNGVMDDCFYVYDISNPYNEKLTSVDDLLSYCYDVKVDGNIAYVSDSYLLVLYNVTDPYLETYIHSADIGYYLESYGVWNFGPYVMSAAGAEGVYLVNETDTSSVTATLYPDATGALQVTSQGDYTYVANQTSLVILRHFESAGDTYLPRIDVAQSLEIDSTSDLIYSATLYADDFAPYGVGINYFLSADGGSNWEAVTPGVEHDFANVGNDLRWKVEIEGFKDRSPHLYEISIEYFYSEAPSKPTISDPGDISTTSSVEVSWSASTDDVAIDHYELQVDSEIIFTTPINSYNTTELSQIVTGLTNGTYYFRVRAVDTHDLPSAWSDIVDITVEIPAGLDLPWWAYVIIGGGLLLIIVGVIVIVKVRKRKVPTR